MKNYILIQRGGGTGPLKPQQQVERYCANSCGCCARSISALDVVDRRTLSVQECVFLLSEKEE